MDRLKATAYFKQGSLPQRHSQAPAALHLHHGAFIPPYAASAIEIDSQHTPHPPGIIERTGIETMAAAVFASLPELVRCLAEQVRVTRTVVIFDFFFPLLTLCRPAVANSLPACAGRAGHSTWR